jgi:uncharacterized Zn finger protein
MVASPPDLSIEALRRFVRDDALYQRGIDVAERGAVVGAWRRGNLLLAHVQGSDPLPYSVTLEAPAKGKRWGIGCTCPYNTIYSSLCKHAVAVFYLWATQPDIFSIEPTLDEELAGAERPRWLAIIRESLATDPAMTELLALPPERAKPLRRAINLAPYEEQLRFALLPKHEPPKQAQLARSVLESAAGYQRIGDSPNALRIATLLAETLIQQHEKAFDKLLQTTLTLLELAALSHSPTPLSLPERESQEEGAWLGRVFVWWSYVADDPALAERLLDLILHSYSPVTEGQVIAWLRAQLRHPIHANQKSHHAWRERIRAFLLAYYEAKQNNDALLDLCWEEGDDRRAAITLARQGDATEAIRLARLGLGDATTHRMVAELLAEQGATEAAFTIAHAGRGYHDRGRAALLTWLAQYALAQGTHHQAYEDALAAWKIAPTLERYQLLKNAHPPETSLAPLLADIRADLRVEILIDEEQWEVAAALLPKSGVRRAELTETLARTLSDTHPKRAIELLFELATLHAQQGTRAGYAQAVRALLAAQTVAFSQSETLEFASLLQRFRISHHRKHKLLSSLAESGIE